MTIRRCSAAIVLGLTMVTAPATSVATPDAPPRHDLPDAAYDVDRGPLTPRSMDRSRSSTGPRHPLQVRDATGSTPAAAQGASRYVDGCTGPTSGAFDLRRTTLAVDDATDTAHLALRVCRSGPALVDWADQVVVWRLASTRTGAQRRVEVGRADGGFVVDDGTDAGTADLWQFPSGVVELRVELPAAQLPLDASCRADRDTACLTIEVGSFLDGSDAQDVLPDEGAPTPVWPSPCRADIDPVAAGHVRLTTSSRAAARAVEADLRAAGYRVDAYDDAPFVEILVGASPEVVDVVTAWEEVVDVTRITSRRMATESSDPLYPDQWYLPRLGLREAWDERTGSGVGIAVVDNGVAADRPDLAGRVARGWDAMTGAVLPAGTHSDLGGHGTAVAGLAAADGDNGVGVAGVDWGARIHPVRVFDHEGCFVSENAYRRALRWLADQPRGRIGVANFSLGGSAIEGEDELIAELVANGTTVVAATGNNGDRSGVTPSFPAALPEVVGVGATSGPGDALADYSNQGRHIDVVAPGGQVDGDASTALLALADPVAVGPSHPYAAVAGTSFSTPLVAGLAALYLAAHPAATPADVTRALVTTSQDLGDGLAGYDPGFGFGMVDAPGVLAHEPGQTLVRIAGQDRHETAAKASRRAFPEPSLVDVVLLATSDNYPDALTGGPLAAREHAPVLLTPGDAVHPATRTELARLDPDRVLLLGGPTALSPAVADQLSAAGHTVERIAGEDRYATAATVALGSPGGSWRAWNASDVVYLATGENFPDALPGGAAAAAFDAPLLLTARFELPGPTEAALRALRPSRVVVLGGEAAVAGTVVDQITGLGIRVDRAAGENRYATAIAALCPIPQLCQADTRLAVVTTGEGFADALGGAATAAALRAPLVLVPGTGELPPIVAEAMGVVRPEQMVLLGGQVAVSRAMARQVGQLAVR